MTAEERELRDNLVERMRKGGLDVVTDSEEMQRVIDRLNGRVWYLCDRSGRYRQDVCYSDNDALRALQHDVDAISDQLNRHRDDLKYDEEQLKRANEWRTEAELAYDYHNDKFFQKHHIARTLFIIIQIIGKTKSWENIPFLEQMRHIQHASM